MENFFIRLSENMCNNAIMALMETVLRPGPDQTRCGSSQRSPEPLAGRASAPNIGEWRLE